jgi:RNA polymerase sigma-70 factor (ECF subfamily)
VDELTRLAHAARRSVPGSVEAFIRASHVPVWRLCEALVDAQTADDLTQETFIKAVGALRRFRGDASARTWILSIARHTCMDELRARSRRQRRSAALRAGPADGLPVPDPCEEIGARDLLAHLEADRRAAFTLTQLLGLSYEEAAEACGCPVGTIRSRVARARADLIEMLGAESSQAEGYGGRIGRARSPRDRQPRTS